jgi:two-component system NtrC family sensor kinase
VPGALEAMNTGIGRVASIVRAMKELAHPGPRDASQTDINRALGNALEVTGAAYRYVADVAIDLEPLPPVVCFPDELNQVFLNLIINASHAMEDRDLSRRGTLGIRTRVDGDEVVISVSDSGCGILEVNRDRIFDAFFTTKQVGRGTGQGLAIARTIVVDRHHGSLTFDTTVGRGTTFHVRIPIAGPAAQIAQVA